MVLLTSSAISVAISSTVVCIFTFLLFLSGYVLQQQTVRSIQDALRRPPEAFARDSLVPLVFDSLENDSTFAFSEQVEQQSVDQKVEEPFLLFSTAETGQKSHMKNPTKPDSWALTAGRTPAPLPEERLAYIISLQHPSTLCSALMFTKSQREHSHLTTPPAIMFLYPSTWETSSSPTYTAALNFMREVQDKYSLIYHPVDISSVWDVEAQLLGELQRTRWDYDRVMYLRSPGLALDTPKLDSILRFSSLKKSWTPLSASAGLDPDMMLISREKGLMTPKGELLKLTASAITSHANHHEGEMDMEITTKGAAYIVFDDAELQHRRTEKEWFGGLFERFERERAAMCKGRGLLEKEERSDLRRRGARQRR